MKFPRNASRVADSVRVLRADTIPMAMAMANRRCWWWRRRDVGPVGPSARRGAAAKVRVRSPAGATGPPAGARVRLVSNPSRICVILRQLWHVWHCFLLFSFLGFFFLVFFGFSFFSCAFCLTFSCSLSGWQRQQSELFHVFASFFFCFLCASLTQARLAHG